MNVLGLATGGYLGIIQSIPEQAPPIVVSVTNEVPQVRGSKSKTSTIKTKIKSSR